MRDARRLLELLTGLPHDPGHPQRQQLVCLARAVLDCFASLGGAAGAACAVCTREPALFWPSDVRRGRHCSAHAARFHSAVPRPLLCCEDAYDPDHAYAWREQPQEEPQPQDTLQ